MHLLDRLAATVIILQFLALLFFGWVFSTKLDAIQQSIRTNQTRVVILPTPTPTVAVISPSVSVYYKGTSSATRAVIVSPSK